MGPKRVEFQGAEKNILVADRYGTGNQPVVMLHGGGQTRHSWDAAAVRIAALGHPVYVLDQRGHGESDWVASENYLFSDFALDLVAVTRQVVALHKARSPWLLARRWAASPACWPRAVRTRAGFRRLCLSTSRRVIDHGGRQQDHRFHGRPGRRRLCGCGRGGGGHLALSAQPNPAERPLRTFQEPPSARVTGAIAGTGIRLS